MAYYGIDLITMLLYFTLNIADVCITSVKYYITAPKSM